MNEFLSWSELGFLGKALINLGFASALLGMMTAAFASLQRPPLSKGVWAVSTKAFWGLQLASVVGASAVLLVLIANHQFQYYYVWNYTSLDLPMEYLLSAFYGGQEGSFLLWILMSSLLGLGLMAWTRAPYRWPVMSVMGFTQVFLLSMLLGWSFGDGVLLGASPFRTLLEEMPNAPFLQANPDFVPADGRGLNDLLKSPWMMIHPPALFVGFAMMTAPFAFAIASLWTRTYHEWVRPALPWTLSANVFLLTAIFLGGYWAYETLSFGGFWAWDPVENASLVPWLIGTAGIHTMIIQKKSSRAHSASLFFAIFAYVLIIYETFLTRSGVLANASVHSFVDLGLYNQLLAFMIAITALGFGFYFWRYRDLPKPKKESSLLSREVLTFTGSMLLLVLGLVIILGTSSPIIGRLFYDNPTPPDIQFYNDWSGPLALVMGVLTVIGQMVFWQRHSWVSLGTGLLLPTIATTVITAISAIMGQVNDLYSITFFWVGWFTVIGNGWVMGSLLIKKPALIGGTVTHIGFGVLLIGILASSKYSTFMVPPVTESFNARVAAGEAFDEDGFPITTQIESFELQRNQPKVIDQQYMVTYEGYELKDTPRPGTQVYTLTFQPLDGRESFTLSPEVYPMSSTADTDRVDWSVDPDILTGWMSDIYLFVGGSALVERRNEQIAAQATMNEAAMSRTVSGQGSGASSAGAQAAPTDSIAVVSLLPNNPVQAGPYQFTFSGYEPAQEDEVPENTQVAIRANIQVTHMPTGRSYEVVPLFAVFIDEGENFTYSPSLRIEEWGLDVQFSSIVPNDESIEITVAGLNEFIEEDWIYLTVEKKPFVSAVWLGTFLLMGGFSISIFRHWGRDTQAKKTKHTSDSSPQPLVA